MPEDPAGAAPTISEAFPPTLPPEEEPPTPEEIEAERQQELSARALQHRAELLVETAKTDGFGMVLRELDAKRERMRKTFADMAFAGEAVDQRQIDYDRGFIDGLAYIGKMIEGAENVLKRLDRESSAESEPENDDPEGDLW